MKHVRTFLVGLTVMATLAILTIMLVGSGASGWTPSAARADGQAIFEDSGQLLGEATSYDVALGDVDGDGDVDAFVANLDAPHALWINQGGDQGGPPGFFEDSGQTLGSGGGQGAALGDLDGDGDLDAFVVTSAFPDANQVFINQGVDTGQFSASGQQFGYANGTAVALGLLDGDAHLDAYVTHRLGVADRLWKGSGNGAFVDALKTLEDEQSIDVELGDLDGDGDLDAFLAIYASSRVWLNANGSGDFVDSGQALDSGRTESVALADVDGDGDLDAYVATSGSTDKIWLNQGGSQGGSAGVFQDSGQILSSGTTSSDAALGDVDGDGDVDVVVAKLAGGGNELWINQGGAQGGQSGVFLDSGQQLGSGFSRAVALADLNGDNSLDQFVARADGPNMVWFNQQQPGQATADLVIEMGGDRQRNEACCSFGLLYVSPFRITVTNMGPDRATNVKVNIDVLFSSGSITHSCNWTGTCEVAHLGTLEKDQSIELEVQLCCTLTPSDDYDGSALWGRLGVGSRVSSSESDPVRTNNHASSLLFVVDCERENCLVEELFCGANNSTGTSDSNVKWFSGLIAKTADFAPNLITYYRVRDEVMAAAPDGKRYIDLYYAHNDEIKAILTGNQALQDDAFDILEIWEPSLEALVKGKGESVTVTAGQMQGIDQFLMVLSAVASPELQQVISAERAKLPPLEDFIGLTLEEARGIVVGYAAYTPIVSSGN